MQLRKYSIHTNVNQGVNSTSGGCNMSGLTVDHQSLCRSQLMWPPLKTTHNINPEGKK